MLSSTSTLYPGSCFGGHQALFPCTLEAKGLVISLQGKTNGVIQGTCCSARSRVRSGLTAYHLCDMTPLANIRVGAPNRSPGAERKGAMCPRARVTAHGSYPESTPSTRLSIKKEPIMMRGMKYNQFQVLPAASFVWKRGDETSRQTTSGCLASRPPQEGPSKESGLCQICSCPTMPSLGRGFHRTRQTARLQSGASPESQRLPRIH